MKKNCTTKNRIKDEQKKDIFQKQKFQNQKLSTPMKLQQTHINNPKQTSLCISKMSKLKKHSVAKTRSSWKLPICDNFIETKTLQHKFTCATTTTPVELNK